MITKFFLTLIIGFIYFTSYAQSFKEVYEKIELNNYQDIKNETLDSVISICPDISKYPYLLHLKGADLFEEGKLDFALKYNSMALQYYPKDSIAYRLNTLFNSSQIYQFLEFYPESYQANLEAQELAKELQDSLTLFELQYLYVSNKAYEGNPKALDSMEQFIRNYPTGDLCWDSSMWIDMAALYFQHEKYEKNKKIMDSLRSFEKQLEEECHFSAISIYYLNVAELFTHEKKYDESLEYLNKLSSQLDTNPMLVRDELILYDYYIANFLAKNETDSVTKYKNLSIELNQQNQIEIQQRSVGNQKEAALLQTVNDKITRRSNNRMALMIGITLLIIFISVYLLRKYYFHKKKLEKDSLKTNQENQTLKKSYFKIWNSYQSNQRQLEKVKQKLPKENLIQKYGELVHSLQSEKNKIHFNLNPQEDSIYQEIENEFPYLSDIEKLVCYYKKFDLSHKEIAKILDRSIKSIDSYQYRINRKVSENQATKN